MEQKLFDLAGTVVQTGFKRVLAKRRSDKEAGTPLSELIASRTSDLFVGRRFANHVESVTLAVAERLKRLCRNEISGLDEEEQAAAVVEATRTMASIDASDAALFEADMRPERIAAGALKAAEARIVRAEFSEGGRRFYELLVHFTAECLVQLMTSLPNYSPRALTEVLERSSRTLERLDAALQRLPVPTLFAPQGDALDEEFRSRYLRAVSENLDELELFGVDVRNFQARTSLSVAYIGLTVRANLERHDPRDLHQWRASDKTAAQDRVMRVEEVLGGARRILLRGEAGSGKSTLLRWLAITAARHGFQGELAELNGVVPVLIKLRSCTAATLSRPEELLAGATPELAGLMPPNFMHRALESGRVLLLIDGVDEIAANDRPKMRGELLRLLRTFPDNRVVVTSRPSAATANWLADEEFEPAMLERMSPSDIRELIRHWHKAIRGAGDLPCDQSELPAYERSLLAKLETSADLRMMATTPLLCAMLCALNLDRRRHLPHNRVELYQAALAMLIDRRDAEREITVEVPRLGQAEKLVLLRDLAWRLSLNHRSELPREAAVERVAKKLTAMPNVDHAADETFEYLLERSGVIREPQPGRIDFVHRTFQEFLTAAQAADNGDIGLLVGHAHRDQWREVVVLAAGLANARDRTELLTGLLDRAASEKRHARRLRVLAASCLETTTDVDLLVTSRVEEELRRLLPPRSDSEAASIARIGTTLVRYLPNDPEALTEAAASGTIRATALVNGPGALRLLERFTADPRAKIQKALIDAWRYFDPEQYAAQVLANAPLIDGEVQVGELNMLPALRHLRRLKSTAVSLNGVSDISILDNVPHLDSVTIFNATPDLKPLLRHPNLTSLNFGFGPLNQAMADILIDDNQKTLSQLRNLTRFACAIGGLDDDPHPSSLVCTISEWAPQLTGLVLLGIDLTEDLETLLRQSELVDLSLFNCAVADLEPLARCKRLRILNLLGLTHSTGSLRIPRIPQLSTMSVASTTARAEHVDLSGFGDQELLISANKETTFHNVGPNINLLRR